jgi:hypothetical protein
VQKMHWSLKTIFSKKCIKYLKIFRFRSETKAPNTLNYCSVKEMRPVQHVIP